MASLTVATAVQPSQRSAASHAGADGSRGAERHAAAGTLLPEVRGEEHGGAEASQRAVRWAGPCP